MKVFTFFLLLLVCALGVWAQQEGGVIGPVIGIDLGTTYSCVGVYKHGKVEIIPNEQGNRITPSYVAFSDEGERLIGDAAKNQATLNPSNTIYDIKRFIGRRFSDSTVQRDKSLLPFSILNKEGKPYVEVAVKGSKKKFSPEEISSMVLTKMKEIAESFLGLPVKNAVITVPAYFNDAQRQSTKDAGTIAGLNVVRIINEPTAAAIAYGLKRENKDHKILVFDLGGGTFDVTVLTLDGGVFEVLATNGDTHLGGEDFDQRIVEYYMKKIKLEKGVDISKDKRALAKLRRAAEGAKRTLSTEMTTSVEIEGIIDGDDFADTLTRAKFEQLNDDLFQKTMGPVAAALKDSGLSKKEIDEIVLVGGSTKIPRVQALLSKYFDGKKLNKEVNPDEAVAYGAAVQGGILCGEGGAETKEVLLLDVTPLTLGLEITGGVMLPFIQRNSVIPTKKTKMLTTEDDYQTSVPITVFQGERPKARDNVKLGHFDLNGIPPMKKGIPQIEVTFELDANGILSVHAVDTATKKSGSVTITADRGRLSEDDIQRMVQDSEKYAEEDRKWKEKMDSIQELESYVYSMTHALDEKNVASALSESDRSVISESLSHAEVWLDNHKDATSIGAEDFQKKLNELKKKIDPIMASLYKGKEGAPGGAEDEEDYHDDL